MDEQEYMRNLKDLDAEVMIHWHPMMRGGLDLWNSLVNDMLRTPCLLSMRQQCNALLIILRLRAWGDPSILYAVLTSAVKSDLLKVRDRAARYLVGLIELSRKSSRKMGSLDSKTLIDSLRGALVRGVEKDTELLINQLTGN